MGGSLSGDTCSGPQLPFDSACSPLSNPVFYFAVDVPSDAPFTINPGPALVIVAFESCGGTIAYCSNPESSLTFTAGHSLQLFAAERTGACGDFELTIGP
jgi:hypothetical protein